MIQLNREAYRRAVFPVVLVAVLVVSAFILAPFIAAILWATVLSILTYPLFRRVRDGLLRRSRLPEPVVTNGASLVITLGTLVLLIIPLVVIGLAAYTQISDATSRMAAESTSQQVSTDTVLASIDGVVQPIADRIGAREFSVVATWEKNREQIVGALRSPLTSVAGKTLHGILTLVVAFLTMFFMLRDGHRLRDPALDLMPVDRETGARILDRVEETVFGVFVGTVLVAIIQGLVLGLGLWWVGAPEPMALGFFAAILCIIPLLGAPVVYVPIALLFLAQGEYAAAIKILVIGFAVVSQIDNILKPIVIGGRLNLHAMSVFFSILGGVIFFGPVGVIAGPMTLAVLLAMLEMLRANVQSPTPAPTEPAT